MYIIRLIGLLLFAVFVFIGRFGLSAVASEDVVINQVTDKPVLHLEVLQSSPNITPLNDLSTPDQVFAQPVSYIRIMDDESTVSRNLPPFNPVGPIDQAGNDPCHLLHSAVTELLASKVTQTKTPFTDVELGLRGIDCKLTALKSSADPEDYVALAQELKASLESQGWREDETYIAYGPNEMTLALEENSHSGLLTVGWQTAAQAACYDKPGAASCSEDSFQRLYYVIFSFSSAASPMGSEITIIRDRNDY